MFTDMNPAICPEYIEAIIPADCPVCGYGKHYWDKGVLIHLKMDKVVSNVQG